jgi:hypothetical protein
VVWAPLEPAAEVAHVVPIPAYTSPAPASAVDIGSGAEHPMSPRGKLQGEGSSEPDERPVTRLPAPHPPCPPTAGRSEASWFDERPAVDDPLSPRSNRAISANMLSGSR